MAATPAELLDWKAFSEKYFPGRRRHDFEALLAYAAHRRSQEIDKSKNSGEHRAAIEAWEDEGGPAR